MKLIIYQTFPRILTNSCDNPEPNGTLERNGAGKMNHYTPEVLASIRGLGVNAIWYTGILEMATKTDFSKYGIEPDNPHVVKGEAGSPYAIKDYYDVDPSIAEDVEHRMAEFEALVERTHAAGMKVIIDFVPNHTARRYHSDCKPEGIVDFGATDNTTMCFSPTNDYYYITNQRFSPSIDLGHGDDAYVEFPAKATGNDCFTAFCGEYDWYETVKLNYGRDYATWQGHYDPVPPLWKKMVHILRYWCAKGVDGFRCDMVFMVPLEFWHWAIDVVKQDYPDVFFMGEIYDVSQYRPFIYDGGFDYLYDKVNLYDTLVGIEKGHLSTANLTGCWQTVEGIGDRMVNFLENHDEVRFGSQEYAGNPANVLPSLAVSALMGKGPFILYYGQEIGESATENEGFAGYNSRTTIFDYWSYSSMRRWYNGGKADGGRLEPQEKWLRSVYSRVLTLAGGDKAFTEGEFFDLMYANLSNPWLDPHRQYAFFRYLPDGAIYLVVANFDYNARKLHINIPELAFTMIGLPDLHGVSVKDMISDTFVEANLEPHKPFAIEVDGKSAVVLKLYDRTSEIKKRTKRTKQ